MYTIYSCLRGSYAQGLEGPTSDKDYFKIIVPSADAIIGLGNQVGSQTIKDGIDVRTITLKEFLRGALVGKSTELEVLSTRVEHQMYVHRYGQILIDNKHKLVSRRLFKGLLGFFDGQMKRMRGNRGRINEEIGYDPKMGSHGLRAIWQAITLKETGELQIFVHDPVMNNLIRQVKNSEISLDKLLQYYTIYERRFNSIQDTNIQENPDYDWANKFLMDVYRETCN